MLRGKFVKGTKVKKIFYNDHYSFVKIHVKKMGVTTRAATFTRVNGTVSCFCNKRLQN